MDYNRIIAEKGLKKIHIAKQIGVSPTMLSLFLHNKKPLTHRRLIKLKEVLGLNSTSIK